MERNVSLWAVLCFSLIAALFAGTVITQGIAKAAHDVMWAQEMAAY